MSQPDKNTHEHALEPAEMIKLFDEETEHQMQAFLGELEGCGAKPTLLARETDVWLKTGSCELPIVDKIWDILCLLDPSPEGQERHRELLNILSDRRHKTKDERFDKAIGFIFHHISIYSGLLLMYERSSEYQLKEELAWWGQGKLFDNNRTVQKYKPRTLEKRGFRQLEQQLYRSLIRNELVLELTRWSQPITMAIITAYTDSLTAVVQLAVSKNMRLQATLTNYFNKAQTAVPMSALYSLPLESRIIQHFYLTADPHALEERPQGTLRGTFERARAKLAVDEPKTEGEPPHKQLALFDADMVLKESGRGDTFVTLRFDHTHPDAVQALVLALQQMGIASSAFEHLPRIVTGIFTAANLDRHRRLGHSGAFWDTESGNRLCQLIGFDETNHKHRKRIQDARTLLMNVVMHREIFEGSKGKRKRVDWSGPLIQPLKERITLSEEDREGFSERHVFKSFLLASELWNMTRLEEDGGTPSFVLIDHRAFELDTKTSVPFNIYWTLLNRAHIERHDLSGELPFSIKLQVLIKWSGLEQDSDKQMRPERLSAQIAKALDRMVEVGLLLKWSCAPLRKAKPHTQELQDAKLEVIFSPRQRFEYNDQIAHIADYEGEQRRAQRIISEDDK